MLGGEAPRSYPRRAASHRVRPCKRLRGPRRPVGQTNAVTEAQSIPPAPVTLGARNPNPAPQASGVNNVPRPPERYGSANAVGTPGTQPSLDRRMWYPSPLIRRIRPEREWGGRAERIGE